MLKVYIKLAKFTQKIRTTYLKGVSSEQFLHTLKKKNVSVVVDIRDWSVFPVYFNPLNMRILLDKNKIEYLKLGALGNPKVLRDRYKNNPTLAKEAYFNYIINTKEAKDQLITLFKLLRFNKIYCLICYCPVFDPKLCHRYWVKELLVNLKRKALGLDANYELDYKPKQLVPEVS